MVAQSDASCLCDFCVVCKGLCCRRGVVVLSHREVEMLGAYRGYIKEIETEVGKIFFIDKSLDDCPCLTDAGCIIPQDIRPLDCRIYPLNLMLAGGRIHLLVSRLCPAADQIKDMPQWLVEKKQLIREMIPKLWTKEELFAHSLMVEDKD